MKAVYLETYGCQMNESDSDLVLGYLGKHGFLLVDTPTAADVILVNTCAVREHAEVRAAGRIAELAKHKQRNPALVLGMIGCMAQHLREKALVAMPYVDLIVGPDSYRRLPHLLAACLDENGRLVEVTRHREETYADFQPVQKGGVKASVTIMRGCDRFCTFCIVPYTRGRERSLPIEDVLRRVRELSEAGVKEVTLLGQTVNSYHDGAHDFADLLHAANAVDGLRRIRFTSPYPSLMTERVIEAMAQCEKVCPSLHLPLQSASNPVLDRMGRGYTIEEFDLTVAKVRETVPDIALGTDILVGFPGETEEDFQATLAYVTQTRFDYAFMFKYSPRSGTAACKWPDTISEEEKGRRLQQIIDLQEQVSAEINVGYVGRETEVLVEGAARRSPDSLCGKNPQFKTVVFPRDGHSPGELATVNIVSATAHTLIGRSCDRIGEEGSNPAIGSRL